MYFSTYNNYSQKKEVLSTVNVQCYKGQMKRCSYLLDKRRDIAMPVMVSKADFSFEMQKYYFT